MVPQSIMPTYAFLANTELDTREVADFMRTNHIVGVPYTDEDIANAVADIKTQVNPDSPDAAASRSVIPSRRSASSTRKAPTVTEADAVVAYLQMLGTLVDFKVYDDKANLR